MALFQAFRTTALPPELQKKLSELGVNLDDVPECFPYVVGIGSASGTSERQATIDEWIKNGGSPFKFTRC